MAYTTVVAGTVITASWGNTDVRDQVIVPFASTAARDAAITAPVAGQVAATTDTYSLWFRGASAWVQVGPLATTWATWTPTLTQSGTVTATVTYGRYMRVGRTIIAQCDLAATGAGTGNNKITVSLPVTAAAAGSRVVGSGHVYDTSGAVNYSQNAVLDSTTTAAIHSTGAGQLLGVTGSAFNGALAAGDAITFSLTYEAAS